MWGLTLRGWSLLALIGIGGACLAPEGAAAADLVLGAPGAATTLTAPPEAQAILNDADGAGGGELSLQFTPRNPLLLLLGDTPEPASEPTTLRLQLGSSSDIADRLGVIEGGTVESGPGGTAALEIGGALHWSDWAVGSAYTRTRLFGGDADLISASLGYGRMTARLAYGESTRPQSSPSDVLLFSTDLAAWSWLSLEGDLALSSSPTGDEDSMAAGRLGIRLHF
jgi:hypothetical protein